MAPCLAAAVMALTPTEVEAQAAPDARGPAARTIPWPTAAVKRGEAATLATPLVVARGSGKLGAPVWTHGALWTTPPMALRGLAGVEKPGRPLYDLTSRAWYASANGCLVRVAAGGSLPVLTCGVQGVDVHVRASRGLAVSREPDHGIVLHRFGARGRGRQTLRRGARYFNPRLSPEGTAVLLSESHPDGGRVWLMRLDGRARDLGPGSDPAWHPDGRRVLLSRVRHDGSRVLGGELWQLELASGKRTQLTRTAGLAEVNPAVSPDGGWVAYVNARTGDLLVARLPGGRP